MTWIFDHGDLREKATTLRSTADGLAATRSSILSRLGAVGRYSGSTSALSAAVDAMRGRASDLDGRVAYLDQLAVRVRQDLGVDTFASMLLAPPPPTEEERLTLALVAAQSEIDQHSGWVLDAEYFRLVAKAAVLGMQLRRHREQLLAEALENRNIALGMGSVGSWVDVMRVGAEEEILRLTSALGVTRQDLVEVSVAMRSGISPAAAGLPEYLFPADYVSRMAEAGSLQVEIEEVREELEAAGDTARLAYWEMKHADGILGGLVLRDSDYRAKAQAYEDARDVEHGVAQRLAGLEARYEELTAPVSRQEVYDYLAGVPFVRPTDRSRVVGEYLATEWETGWEDFAAPEEHLEILELLKGHDGVAAAAFYNTLDAAGTYRTANLALNAFSTDEHQAEAMIRLLSETLGAATLVGELSFSGADLINGVGLDPMIVNTVDPAWLFTYGSFSDEFLVSATVAAVARGEIPANTGMQHFTPAYEPATNLGAVVDARVMLLQQFADLPDASVMLVNALGSAGLLEGLLDAEFRDDGVAMGDVLANLVDVPGPSGMAATTAAVMALAGIEAEGHEVEAGVAIGAAVMVAPHIDSFVPSVERQRELGTLYIPGELPMGVLREHLEAEGADSQATLEALMHVVLGEEVAAEVFITNMMLFNYETLGGVADPSQPDLRHQYTNDLAGLEGLTSAIWIDEHLADAADEDARNSALRQWTGIFTAAAITTAAFFFAPATVLGSAGYAAIAKFGVGQVVGNGVKSLYTNEAFPVDNLEKAQMDAIAALTRRDPYGYAVLQALSDQGALVDATTGETVTLEIDLAELDSIDNHELGELLSTLVVIDPATGLPSAEPEPLDWFIGGSFLTLQEISEVVGTYLEDE